MAIAAGTIRAGQASVQFPSTDSQYHWSTFQVPPMSRTPTKAELTRSFVPRGVSEGEGGGEDGGTSGNWSSLGAVKAYSLVRLGSLAGRLHLVERTDSGRTSRLPTGVRWPVVGLVCRQTYAPADGRHCWRIRGLNVTSAFMTRCGHEGRRCVGGRVGVAARQEDRRITLHPRTEQEVIQQARAREDTMEWKEEYACRAGVEGTISQGVRAFGLRRCRYYGLAKAQLQHQLTATAMNLHLLNAWWTDIHEPVLEHHTWQHSGPPSRTRRSGFANSVEQAGGGSSSCTLSHCPYDSAGLTRWNTSRAA
ncbi:transposase [Streptomyces sp. NPDC050636]|uniref:transposase n=1 Tax=Streptomyces sp. NPDC050636 TaxID=3154510 RepID=UPI0034495A51